MELLGRKTLTNETPTWYDAYCELVSHTDSKLLKEVKSTNQKPKTPGIPSNHGMITRGRTVLNNTTVDEVSAHLQWNSFFYQKLN